MFLGDNLVETEKELMKSQEQKARMMRIIEICDINKIQNEEWIRGLNFYVGNLKKVITSERRDIKLIGKIFLLTTQILSLTIFQA